MPKLMKCSICNADIPSDEDCCPRCGAKGMGIEKQPHLTSMYLGFGMIVFLVFISITLLSKINNSDNSDKKQNSSFNIDEETCYAIGIAYGACKIRKENSIACERGTNFVMPIRCEGEEETQKGIKEGIQTQKALIVADIIKKEEKALRKKRINAIVKATQYLESNLRDPSSYESIQWSPLIKLKNGSYGITHKYRAKNGFGGVNVEVKTFLFSSSDDILGIQ